MRLIIDKSHPYRLCAYEKQWDEETELVTILSSSSLEKSLVKSTYLTEITLDDFLANIEDEYAKEFIHHQIENYKQIKENMARRK